MHDLRYEIFEAFCKNVCLIFIVFFEQYTRSKFLTKIVFLIFFKIMRKLYIMLINIKFLFFMSLYKNTEARFILALLFW